jgi:hypothetical protein
VALLAVGCVPLQILDPSFLDSGTPVVPSSPFGASAPVPPATTVNYPPASTELSLHVDAIGRAILKANKDVALEPLFASLTFPQAEIFHRGTNLVYVTDSLVKQCKTDAELAAVLALELAKMVAEREALAAPRARNPQGGPPPEVLIGNAAQPGPFDAARMAELARYDKQRREAAKVLPPPDPDKLAARYLEKAGYPANSLEAVQPLLQLAETNYTLEKQIKMSDQPRWTAP